jgi:hypothetical protein
MKKKLVGLLVLFVLSEALGLGIGHVFFQLFHQTVPPAVLTSFNRGTAHAAFLAYGLGAGIVIFLWSLLAMGAARVFRAGGGGAA